jgi:farnesyl-diphosphate farnesyltransferase
MLQSELQHTSSQLERANAFCREVLPAVSRTFALSIRLLPGTLGAAVQCAYLICRIADTVEDEPALSAAEKAGLLEDLAHCFDEADAVEDFLARVKDIRGDPAHLKLIRRTDLVFVVHRSLPDRTRARVRHWVREMIAGMRKFVLLYPNGIRIQSLEEYREYCYYVAGTVGYLLTDLWHEHSASIGVARYELLRARCRAFAEALQTVNILKDVARDAAEENSIYIPEEVLRENGSSQATIFAPQLAAENRAALATLTHLAWQDLDQATAYLLAIPRRAVSIRIFCALPLLFAYATLRDLTTEPNSLTTGHPIKISRSEVKSLTLLSMLGVMSNVAMAKLVARARTKPLLLGW